MSKHRRAVNVTSQIQLKVYEVHAVEKKKTLLYDSSKKNPSSNPVFLDRIVARVVQTASPHTDGQAD